jgi:hypothetical protein
VDLCSPGSSPAGLVNTGAIDQCFECGVGRGCSSRCSRRRGQTNYGSDDPRDLFVGTLYQPAAISSYTGLCPGEHTSGSKRVPGSVTKHGNPRLRAALVECACPESFRGSSPTIRRSRNGWPFCPKEREPPERNAKKRSSPWRDIWQSICGGCTPAVALRNKWD